jgi:photosystem II stability/assembly factor-like uncharacterized protein
MPRVGSTVLRFLTLVFVASLMSPVPAVAQSPDGQCNTVGGLHSVSSTLDQGASYAATPRPLEAGTGTFGIAPLQTEGGFVAEYAGVLYRSSSDGCHWARFATVETSPLRLAPGAGSEAWAWSFINGPEVWRVNAATGVDSGAERRKNLPADVLTIAADPHDGTHLRAIGDNGQIYDSFDSAATWIAGGDPAPVPPLGSFAAINPSDFSNVMIGVVTDGVWTTTDDGATWANAEGLSTSGGPVNGFTGLFSPADPDVAYVMAIDLDQISDPSDGRHIYRSTDRGASFVTVVDQDSDITLINGPVMVADPEDAGVLYFLFGSRFAGGVTLYRYDDASGATTWQFNADHTGARALAIDPDAPLVVHVGFEGP